MSTNRKNIYEWIMDMYFEWWLADPISVTSTITRDIVPFIPTAIRASEGHEVRIDASEGDGESRKSSSETHGMLEY